METSIPDGVIRYWFREYGLACRLRGASGGLLGPIYDVVVGSSFEEELVRPATVGSGDRGLVDVVAAWVVPSVTLAHCAAEMEDL
jgi:hypothetical protein